jgi:hypothetical protein
VRRFRWRVPADGRGAIFLGHRHRGVIFRHQVEAQLKQKEEMGDVLHYIDFHQLQIENKQCVRSRHIIQIDVHTRPTDPSFV